MHHVFDRFPKSTLSAVLRRDGKHVYDKYGNEYPDACGGAPASCLVAL